jgi:cytochrome b6-f complex iron-sulfur subunit
VNDRIDCSAACPYATAAESIPGVDRRSFLVAAAALALAACAGGDGSGTTAPDAVGATVDVAAYPSLANTNGVALVTLSATPLAIVRTGTATFLALARACPHQGATVNTSAGGFTCPRHGARFSLTGSWVGGERTSSMRSYPTQYDAATGKLAIG